MKGKQQDFRTEKYIRYGIRKYSFGAASVAIAAGLMFLGNGAVSATEVQTTEIPVAATNASAQDNKEKAEPKAETVETVKPETEKAAELKPEVKVANKATLEAKVAALESKLSNAKYADASVVSSAKEVLTTAKATLAKAEASQVEVDKQVETVVALSTVVAESDVAGFEKKEAADKEAAKAEAEKTATPVEKALSVATTTLTQVSSEAEVTNKLAETELAKADVKEENKAAVTAAVAKNKAVLAETKAILADKSITKKQVDAQLERLNESILAVYNELKNAGINRDGKFAVALSANEGYTYNSRELRKENGEFTTATGKSYAVLDNNNAYRLYVHGYQSDNTELPIANNGKAGISGHTDIPLSKTEAQKLGREASLWNGKVRATGVTNKGGNSTYGAGGAYEYLATEIYGYTYEQGNHYAYLTDVTKRFSLSEEAKKAGYTITEVRVMNMPPGLAYNKNSDTIEGYVAANIQNGVYDMRYEVTVEKDGTPQKVSFKNLTAGWIGWQDSSAPLIQGSSKLVTIGDQVSHDIKYVDNDGMERDSRANFQYTDGSKVKAGSKTAPTKIREASFTAVDGTTLKTEWTTDTRNQPQTVTAHTALNGVYTGSETSITDVVPGLDYNPQTGLITGTAREAGIYTVAAYAKDYNNSTNSKSKDWTMNGQEAHENITIAVAPKITVSNVAAYATKVPVTISQGANTAEITMPDGTVTKLEVKNGNWTVAEGTTNTSVNKGDVSGAAPTT